MIPDALLCKTTWPLIDQAASKGVRFLQERQKHQQVKALRPEAVIVSTLQQLLSVPNLTADHQRGVFLKLELVGGLIRDAARDGPESARHWFNSKVWVYAVLLSAGSSPNKMQARPLYRIKRLQQLLKLFEKEPGHAHGDDSIFEFYRALLQVSSPITVLTVRRP